ncbi:hypothetical protein BpHYR1_033642 [Brachionus plicatilis]|uniref:Uncharacterized protein n=1 Tax=Brachionus plicatilis TaxID=10195 RepID=A0A3M7PGC5_BRAPC|nr:hypothetical protein BpHYR1_033642 [Brachionus plicatilis]
MEEKKGSESQLQLRCRGRDELTIETCFFSKLDLVSTYFLKTEHTPTVRITYYTWAYMVQSKYKSVLLVTFYYKIRI